MKRVEDFKEIYLCKSPLDFRRGKEAMIAIIEGSMDRRAMSGALFGFTNRRRDKIRCLYWDKTGFAHWGKTLEKAAFQWPKRLDHEAISLSARELGWLLDGIEIDRLKPHEGLEYSAIS